jgi:hypothetical protein
MLDNLYSFATLPANQKGEIKMPYDMMGEGNLPFKKKKKSPSKPDKKKDTNKKAAKDGEKSSMPGFMMKHFNK